MVTFDNAFALSIGVGGDLPVTIQDATAVAKQLRDEERCAYPVDNVHLITGQAATRDGILDGLDWLAQVTSRAEDPAVIVYFSGHGSREHSLQAFRGAKNTTVTSAEFTEQLSRIKAKRLLLLLDCCYAAGVWDPDKGREAWQKQSGIGEDVLEQLQAGSGRVVISSSRRDETSFVGEPFSVFTTALLESLSGEGVAEKDGFVRLGDLMQWVSRRVPELTKNHQHVQHPVVDFSLVDNFPLAWYGGGGKETRGVPEWVGKRAPISELMEFPPGPIVPSEWLPAAVIEAFANRYGGVEDSALLLSKAVQWVVNEDPGATFVRATRLPDISRATAESFWFAAFNEARRHGPRMVAALLLSFPEKIFPRVAKAERDELLRRMRFELM